MYKVRADGRLRYRKECDNCKAMARKLWRKNEGHFCRRCFLAMPDTFTNRTDRFINSHVMNR